MRTRADLAVATLSSAQHVLLGNVAGLTLEEALSSAGGYRSALGILKHTAAWTHVYYSYAFEPEPKHWRKVEWPLGLGDTIEPSQAYFDVIVAWSQAAADRWRVALHAVGDEAIDEPRPCHWGATAPLFDIVLMVANHWCYHAGEINQTLSIIRGAAWEYTEEVEENHVSTAGHRVRPGWMNDDQARAYETYIAARDAQLRGDVP